MDSSLRTRDNARPAPSTTSATHPPAHRAPDSDPASAASLASARVRALPYTKRAAGFKERVKRALEQGLFEDGAIAEWVQRNLAGVLAVSIALLLLASGGTALLLQVGQLKRSLLFDFRRTRDIQFNPRGSHTQWDQDTAKLDSCLMPVRLHFTDARAREWWPESTEQQADTLATCDTPCEMTEKRSEAHVLVSYNSSTPANQRAWWQKVALIAADPDALTPLSLRLADILVSFHRYSDVVVSHLSSVQQRGIPCAASPHSTSSSPSPPASSSASSSSASSASLTAACDCLLQPPAPRTQLPPPPPHPSSPGSLPSPAPQVALFASSKCDRLSGVLAALVARLQQPLSLGVASFGTCFRNAKEEEHPLFVRGNPPASKERIASAYRFLVVAESIILEDFLSPDFFQGLKAAHIMVYIGAPNAAHFSPVANAFVDALQFESVDSLAVFLETLATNQTLESEFRDWRTRVPGQTSAGFSQLGRQDFGRRLPPEDSWECRTCRTFLSRFCKK
ncbi:hypothetical protein T484DRAFT_2830002 [Baffinella frigidus]|nr:hypothetical protein T484DRAFT_2830002 [Cryptophyta sp. CCMP2293]